MSGKAKGTVGHAVQGRVWLVEDSLLEARRTLSLLQATYEVEHFADAESLVEHLSRGPLPDVVLLDWLLPGMSGLEACRYVRGQHDEAALPIIMLTSRDARSDLQEARLSGANDYLAKPYEAVELLSRVGTLVRVRRAVADAQRAQALAEAALADVREAQRGLEAARVRAEAVAETLREREERVRALLESTAEGIWGLDAEGRCTFANPACLRLLGYGSADELLGRDMHAMVHHSQLDGTSHSWEDCHIFGVIRTGHEMEVDDEVVWCKDGRSLHVRYRASPLWREGQVVGAVVAFEDITDRKRAEEALRLSEAGFRTLAEASPEAIFTTTPEGLLTYVSASLPRYTGLGHEEIAGTGYTELIHPDHRAPSMEAWARALRTHEPYEFEHLVRGKDGGYRWHLVRALPVRDAEGRVVKWVGTSVDVHALRQTHAELQRRAEFEEQLIGIVSHDLRNPLSSILLGAQALLRDESLGERQLRGLLRIQSSSERAVRMIRDLLDFTQARMGGGLPMKSQPLDLHALTRQVVEEVQVSSPERTIEVVQEGAGEGVGDPDRLAQVVSNLLSNALYYSPPGTPVRVTTHGEAGALVLQVHNWGAAIAPELLARLFQPMQRGGLEGSTSGRSVGLGLYIVDQVVRAHRGTVGVRSTEAEGTAFTVRLPR